MIVPGIPFIQGINDYTDGDDRKYGIAIHNTSNDASDTGEANYATWRTDGISSHFYCDADSVTQSIDTDDKCGHAGSSNGNENAIAVEITGANGKTRDWWLSNVAWDSLGQVLATVIKHHWPDGSFQVRRASVSEMRSNPRVMALYGHDDMRQAWGGTTHTDPGPNFPWDRLISAIKAGLEDGMDQETKLREPTRFAKRDIGYFLGDVIRWRDWWWLDPAADHGGIKPDDPSINPHPASRIVKLHSAVKEIVEGVRALLARPPVQSAPVDIEALVAALEPVLRSIVREELDKTKLGS